MAIKPLAFSWDRSLGFLAVGILGSTACSGDDGETGPAGPPGPPGDGTTDTELTQGDTPPGVHAEVISISGGTAAGGRFRPGDKPKVNFTVKKTDGTNWSLSELNTGSVLVSGPSFNYQRVIAEVSNVLTTSVAKSDGSYSYTFTSPIPATYLAPFNDTPSFGTADGELTGQDLLDGTYTMAFTFAWNYTVDGASAKEADNLLIDFVVGDAGVIEHREAITIENCNRCHEDLRIHGGRKQEAAFCVLCHTSGAEDTNSGGATPGVTIDFKVMIHKIHAGKHLPSVNGVATNPDGSRNYLAPPTPYIVGGDTDYSHVAFPAWPQGLVATPRDQGYTALSSTDKRTEDLIRTGPSNCIVCHGDPDGDGPVVAPAQGDLYKTQPSRQACGSCHDDVHWGQNYTANGQTMGAQANNANCLFCHAPSGNPLAVADAHLHPLLDPNFDPGLNFDVNDLTGPFNPGDKIPLTFSIKDDAGTEIAPATISNPSVVISGPTNNYNLLLNTSIPTAALTGAQPFTINVPMTVNLERAGVSTAALDTFTTAFTPHWNVAGALTSVLVRTATGGGNGLLSEASAAPQNYVDVDVVAGFARDDYIVVDDGTVNEEYVRIQFVEGNRLWFSSPYTTNYKAGLDRAHMLGATVKEVTLAPATAGTHFSVNAAAGSITELVEFGVGRTVIATYTTDYVLPAVYPLSINDSPDLGEESGEWTGKTLVDGTYSLGIWSSKNLTLNLYGETNSYKSTADAKSLDFLVGSATKIEPYALISSGSNCFNCHQELAFHGFGRRNFESCVLCHGTAGSEDRPQYVAGAAPDTTGVTVNFRTMLHKIHMGEELTHASTYDIIGFGSGAYPNNFAVANFEEIIFPALPGGVQNCNKCHGNDAWHEPAPRNHPTEQGAPVKRWTAVCGSCHDSTDAQAHINVQTDSMGNESCGICHGPGNDEDVERVHKPY